jgi:hypothetical protein
MLLMHLAHNQGFKVFVDDGESPHTGTIYLSIFDLSTL